MAGALDLFKLDGRVAIVTGGAKSLGMFYTTALLEVGAKVVAADIDADAVRETTARLSEEHPGRVLGIVFDVSNRESIADMVRRVDEQWGRIDVLVNNAAVSAGLEPRQSPWGIPEDEWDVVMRTNIRGIYDCTEACMGLMTRNGYGHVINVASGLAFRGAPNMPHYAASKSAVTNLTKTLATALGRHNITVNSIAPGFTESPSIIAKRESIAAVSPQAAEFLGSAFHIPGRAIKRAEMPEDLVGTVLFLASPASDFVTGQTLVCDGGSVYN